MEYCAGGSLYQYLRERNTGLDENEFKTYLEQILNGVQVHLPHVLLALEVSVWINLLSLQVDPIIYH